MVDKKPPVKVMGVKSNPNAIVIHVSRLGESLVTRLIMECNNTHYWHKFVIGNVEAYERDFILKTIMDFVSPADLIPVNFVKEKRAFFLARNCLDAILKLMSSKLVIPNPLHPKTQLRVVIIANYCPAQQLKFDFEESVVTVLKKRFDPQLKSLNLKEFYKDEDLSEFFLLSQPKLMLYVIQFAVELEPKEIDLSNNFLKTIIPLRLLSVCKINSIDLRNNEISRLEDLETLKGFKELKVLKLDGNPICKEWESFNYIHKLKEICPTLDVSDDSLLLPKKNWCPTVYKNVLCSFAGADLTAQFLEHFFMRYDSENRQTLAPLYHVNAMFSVTYRIIPDQKSCRNIQLNHYRAIDRNTKGVQGPRPQFLFQGRKAIMNVFSNFPRTNHDPMEFTCDLIYYTGLHGILVVNGVFREDKRYIGFTRSFVLRCEYNAYRITNDQLHVYNALDIQIKHSDSYPLRVEITGNPLPFYADQFMELQEAVHKITNLNYDYSERFLEACHYDLKKTLEYFVNMHLKDEVPQEAFIQIGKKGLLGGDNLNGAKIQYPNNIKEKTLMKHPVVAPRTVWQTLKDDRLSAEYQTNNAKEAQESEREIVKPQETVNMITAAKTNNNLTVAPVMSNSKETINMVTAAKTNDYNYSTVGPVTFNPQQTINMATIVKTEINPTVTPGMSKSQRKKARRRQRLLEMHQKQKDIACEASNQEFPSFQASDPTILQKDLSTPGLKPIPFVPAASTELLTQSQNTVTDTDVRTGNGSQEPEASYGVQLQLKSPKGVDPATIYPTVADPAAADPTAANPTAADSSAPSFSTHLAYHIDHLFSLKQGSSSELQKQLQTLRPATASPTKRWRCRLVTSEGRRMWVSVKPVASTAADPTTATE